MILKYSEYIKESSNNSQFFKTYDEIEEWLDEMGIDNYKINDDLTVDVYNEVDISHEDLTHIPVQFGIVKGDFFVNDNKLTSLVGSPKEVGGIFDCSYNKLTSLIGTPKYIQEDFIAINNKLTSIEGLSIYNLKNVINSSRYWYKELKSKIKEDYYDKHLEDNPELINFIDFETSEEFEEKWIHLFNANKFDLI